MTGQDGFELVVFDCDGVLVDSEVIAIRVDQRVLADLGWELELDDIVERFVGKSEAHFVAAVEQQLGIRLGDGWDRDYGRWYQEAFERDLEAVDGIEDALDRLSLPHCVASSGSHEKMRRTLGKTGLLRRFQGRIYSATEVANGNPRRTCSSTPRRAWAPLPGGAPSSRTAPTASRPPGRRECTSSRMPAVSPRLPDWPVPEPRSFQTCGCCPSSLRQGIPAEPGANPGAGIPRY